MLNGLTYPYLVKYFWVRAEVYDKGSTALEESKKIAEMGLDEFNEVEIKSVVIEIDVNIT